jgi:hypothetical protein
VCGPGAGARQNPRAVGVRRSREGEGGRRALAGGPWRSEEERRGRPRLDWAGATTGLGGGEGVEKRGLEELGRAWPTRGERGRGKRESGLLGRGPTHGEEREGEQAGLRDGLGWVGLPFSFLSFSSFLYSNYSNTTI